DEAVRRGVRWREPPTTKMSRFGARESTYVPNGERAGEQHEDDRTDWRHELGIFVPVLPNHQRARAAPLRRPALGEEPDVLGRLRRDQGNAGGGALDRR